MHWARIGEAGFTGGMKTMLWINRHVGHWPFRLVLYPVVTWYVVTRGIARRASFEYLQKLHAHSGGKTPAPTLANVIRHFAAFSDAMIAKLDAWQGRIAPERVSASGREHMLRLLEAGRGGVIVTAHIGNFEVARTLSLARAGLKLNILVHTRHAERFNALLAELAPDVGVNLIQVSDLSAATAAMLAERVDAGEFIVLAADRIPVNGGGTVDVPFLGHDAHFPVGAFVLAAVLGCPLLAMITTFDHGRYQMRITQLAEKLTLPRGRREAALQEAVALFVAELERAVHASPLQWFNFFPFWSRS
ncbi:LpxL/LpxP family acyltransferase [Chitinibacteraceae bacterium HSL-7]